MQKFYVATEEDYRILLEYLFSLKDDDYREFNKKIIASDKARLIGVRIPLLRDISKKISKVSGKEFLDIFEKLFIENKIEYYEEKLIYAMVIGYSRLSYDENLRRVEFYIKLIDNWAVCDIADSSFKFVKNNKEDFYKYLSKKLDTKNIWEQRFIFVMLLGFYIEEKYLEDIFKICEKIKSEEYYVNMGKAWLISMCYVKFEKETYNFLKNTSLDKWTVNKSIQKIRESLKVTKEKKEEILILKR